MNTNWFLLVTAGSGALLLMQRTFAEPVVYDNTETYAGTSVHAPNIDVGSEISLAGTERVVRGLTIVVEADATGPVAFTARLSVYVNDGEFEGSPGTLLWQSAYLPQQIEPGAPRTIHFAVPGVLVPDTLIWIVRFVDWETPIDVSQFYPPSVGSVRLGLWVSSTGPTPWDTPWWSTPGWAGSTPIGPGSWASPRAPSGDNCTRDR